MRRTRRRGGTRLLAAVLLAALGLALWHPGARAPFWQGIEGRLIDLRGQLRGKLPAPEGVAILAFDDRAMARLDSFPPARADIAAAVRAAVASGARAVALDMLLIDPREDDPALAAALAGSRAVLAIAEAPAGTAPRPLPPGDFALIVAPAPADPLPALAPAPRLLEVAALGHVAVGADPDGPVRRMRPALPLATSGGVEWYPGLALAAVSVATGAPVSLRSGSGPGGDLVLGARRFPLDLQGALPLLFYGPPDSIPTHSVADAGTADLAGRIVFLGATATGFGDRHPSPFPGSVPGLSDPSLPGVALHATLAANLLEGRSLRRDAVAWGLGAALALLAAASGLRAAGLERPRRAALAMLGVTGLVAGALQAAFLAGWWLDAVTALMALALGLAAGAGQRSLAHRRRAANLARYQSPRLVEAMAETSEPGLPPADRPVAALFVDVAGFTLHSERVGPGRTEAFLRLFHGLVEQAAETEGGVICHFAGDGALVVFGLPEPGPEDAAAALRFVEALYAALDRQPDWPGLGLRVGGHLGPARAGLVGGRRHRHLSVSGDVVNTASRLQGYATASGRALALSDALVTAQRATRGWAARHGLRFDGMQALPGRATPLGIWTGSAPTAEGHGAAPPASPAPQT